MWYVYVLRSVRNGRFYTGSTGDLTKRLEEHARGKSPYTRYAGPFELIYSEEYQSRPEAVRRERFLETGKGRQVLESLLAQREPRSLSERSQTEH
jgi:putative endonuclease